MYHIALIDDQIEYHTILKKNIRTIEKYEINVHCFTSISEFEKDTHSFHFVLLDIDLPDVNGIDYAKQHLEQNIVFITNHSSYMKNAFGPNIYAFIEKDDTLENFQNQIIEAIKRIDNQKIINIKVNKKQIKLFVKDIVYVQYIRRKTLCIKLEKEEYVVHGYGINEFKNELGSSFIMIDRDTLCNIDKIIGINDNKIILKNINHQLKVSKRKLSQVRKAHFFQ